MTTSPKTAPGRITGRPGAPAGATPEALAGPGTPPLLPAGGVPGIKTPAGSTGAPAGTDAGTATLRSPVAVPVPAGRSWTFALPAGLKLLSPNQRLHWAERNRRFQAIKKAAWAMALNARVPALERLTVTAEYQPPDRRGRDADNAPAASLKACIDGLVAAKVLASDECPRYVASVTCTIGEPYPKGRLVITVTEVES